MPPARRGLVRANADGRARAQRATPNRANRPAIEIGGRAASTAIRVRNTRMRKRPNGTGTSRTSVLDGTRSKLIGRCQTKATLRRHMAIRFVATWDSRVRLISAQRAPTSNQDGANRDQASRTVILCAASAAGNPNPKVVGSATTGDQQSRSTAINAIVHHAATFGAIRIATTASRSGAIMTSARHSIANAGRPTAIGSRPENRGERSPQGTGTSLGAASGRNRAVRDRDRAGSAASRPVALAKRNSGRPFLAAQVKALRLPPVAQGLERRPAGFASRLAAVRRADHAARASAATKMNNAGPSR